MPRSMMKMPGGSPTDGLPALAVSVSGSPRKGVFEPSDRDPVAAERLGGYRLQQIAAGVGTILAGTVISTIWVRR